MSCLRDVNKRVFSSLQPCDLSCTSVQFTLYTVESLRVCFVTNQITFPFDLLHIFDRLETLRLCRPVQKKAIKFHCSLHFCFISTALFFLLRQAVSLPCWLLFYWILGRFFSFTSLHATAATQNRPTTIIYGQKQIRKRFGCCLSDDKIRKRRRNWWDSPTTAAIKRPQFRFLLVLEFVQSSCSDLRMLMLSSSGPSLSSLLVSVLELEANCCVYTPEITTTCCCSLLSRHKPKPERVNCTIELAEKNLQLIFEASENYE